MRWYQNECIGHWFCIDHEPVVTYVREITLVKVATIGAGTAYPSGAHKFTPGF